MAHLAPVYSILSAIPPIIVPTGGYVGLVGPKVAIDAESATISQAAQSLPAGHWSDAVKAMIQRAQNHHRQCRWLQICMRFISQQPGQPPLTDEELTHLTYLRNQAFIHLQLLANEWIRRISGVQLTADMAAFRQEMVAIVNFSAIQDLALVDAAIVEATEAVILSGDDKLTQEIKKE